MLRFLITILLCSLAATAIASDPMSPWVAQRLLSILERSVDDPQQTLEELKEFSQTRRLNDDDHGYVMRERVALLIREDQLDLAREEVEQTLAGREDDYVPSLRIMYAQLLLLDGEASAALPQLEIWAAHVSNPHPGELSLLGYAYLQEERFTDAVEIFERLIETAEIVRDQWIELLAYSYTRLGRTDDAIALLDDIINEQPAEARWWRQLGNIYLLLENIPQGAASYSIASITEELSYEDSRRLAVLFNMLNMPADGARVLGSAMQKYPDSVDFEQYMLLGELWVVARELELAIQSFEVAASLSDDGEPALKLSQLYLQWERYQEAKNTLQIAINSYGEETPEQVYYLLAVVEINLDDLQAASEAIGRLQEDGAYAERAQRLDQFIQNQLGR